MLLFAGLGQLMLIRLLLPTKSFRRTLFLLNHFISKVVHDMFWLDCSLLGAIAMHYAHLGLGLGLGPCFRFDVKFWPMDQVRFGYFLLNMLLRMRRNDRSCLSGNNIVQN